jgi:hypothetical protein
VHPKYEKEGPGLPTCKPLSISTGFYSLSKLGWDSNPAIRVDQWRSMTLPYITIKFKVIIIIIA